METESKDKFRFFLFVHIHITKWESFRISIQCHWTASILYEDVANGANVQAHPHEIQIVCAATKQSESEQWIDFNLNASSILSAITFEHTFTQRVIFAIWLITL